MENLITRLRHMGRLFLIGFLLIIYIALGFLYFQQVPQQRELTEQITKLSLILAKPLPSTEKLQDEYDEVNRSLSPMTDKDAIAKLVSIAEKSGIDIDESVGKFIVPPVTLSQAKVGGGTYQLLSFRNIHVQGDYDNVMAFISVLDSGEIVLDSGETPKTIVMVLKSVATSQTENETVATLDVAIYTKPGE